MDRKFEEAHDNFVQSHLIRRTGERKSRLERGHLHAEKLFLANVWWPLFQNFDDLHPEYEVIDWRNTPYFIDFAYIRSFIKIAIEIKGYGLHVRDMDRVKYSNELRREMFLKGLGWRVWSFSYDDVQQHPDVCRMLVQLNMSQYLTAQVPQGMPQIAEYEILRLGCRLARPIRPIDVCRHFSVNHRTAVRWIKNLCEKGYLQPVTSPDLSGKRISRYELAPDFLRYWA
jgi:hypothetical protein